MSQFEPVNARYNAPMLVQPGAQGKSCEGNNPIKARWPIRGYFRFGLQYAENSLTPLAQSSSGQRRLAERRKRMLRRALEPIRRLLHMTAYERVLQGRGNVQRTERATLFVAQAGRGRGDFPSLLPEGDGDDCHKLHER
jgi:hypothetical protein